MSRRNKLLIGLFGTLTLLAVTYVSLPWIISTLIKRELSAQGVSDIQLEVEYPHWRGVRIHSIAFNAYAGEQRLFVEIPDISIGFGLGELLTGTMDRIHVPLITVQAQPDSGRTSSVVSHTALPLAALVSGQWLSQLPVREGLVEQVHVEGRTLLKADYRLQLRAQLRDAQLDLNGDLSLPSPQKPIAFSFKARNTGEVHLDISPVENDAQPILEVAVKLAADDQQHIEPDQIKLNGVLTTKLNTLMPVLEPLLAPFIPELASVSGLEGDLKGQWQMVLPAIWHDNNTSWRAAGDISLKGFGGRWRQQVLPRSEVTTKFSTDSQQATFQSRLSIANKAVIMEAKGVHELAGGNGRADLTLKPVVFSEAGFVLSRLFKDWPYPFDVTTGRMSGSGQVVWQSTVTAGKKTPDPKMLIKLENLGGHYNKTTFAGLSGELPLAYGKGVRTTKDAHLRVAMVHVGLAVENIDLQFGLAAQPTTVLPVIRMKRFAMELLGGKASSEPFELDFSRDKNAFVLQLDSIALHEIMKLEQQEGLQGGGLLDGQLPIEISGEGLVVTQGKLAAREPGGYISYAPTAKVAAMAQSNQSVGMMVKALSNFQYQVLEVNTDYKPGGDLTLKVRLEGNNPEWQGGQPVHLNLNLQENIPTLLRSLQLSDEISEGVSKRYLNKPKINQK